MSAPSVLARITATPAAREAIRLLCAARGAPVMFVQSGGCCAGSTPMCFPAGESGLAPGTVSSSAPRERVLSFTSERSTP